ncbi:MAG: HTH domain-containing protein, partial [Rhodobacteraceae bacterium]|nr:HTH domain-containing protein [Paracoccaceae bacterium]
MRNSSRLFEIIQILRGARNPVTAQTLAQELEVSTRTIYRDIAAMQAMRTPIEGEAGIGYIMRAGYDLPP